MPYRSQTPVQAGETPATERKSNRETTRMRLMLATERLVAEHGVQGVSVRDIAREAEANLSAIDYHFGSKIKLVLATLDWRGRQGTDVREAALRPFEGEGPIDDVRGLLRAVLDIHVNRPSSPGQPTNLFFIRLLTDATPEVMEVMRQASIWFRQDVYLLMRARPDLSFEEACWRYYAIMGLTHLNQFDDARLLAWSDGRCRADDDRAFVFELILDGALALLMLPPRLPGPARATD